MCALRDGRSEGGEDGYNCDGDGDVTVQQTSYSGGAYVLAVDCLLRTPITGSQPAVAAGYLGRREVGSIGMAACGKRIRGG
jgi:hypothetical protein